MANKLDLADAQFIGFHHGKSNSGDIIGLVKSMGLTKREWEKLMKEYPTAGYISDSEVKKIDQYFTKA
jgi:hypothetical protein